MVILATIQTNRMLVLKQLTELAFWFLLWFAIPAVLLYPAAVWMAKHTHFSSGTLVQSYLYAVSLLWLPTAFLVDFIYRRLVRDRLRRKDAVKGQD
jgi:hypothetical protein